MTARADEAADVPDPSLLEIVPWTYGFAHSWALGALLSEPRLLDLILGRAGMPGTPPWRLASDIQRERRLGSARADLAFVIEDSTGTAWNVAGETKVNDPYSPAQVAAYTREDHLPFLYLPGMTGLMWEVAIDSAALRLSGRQLVEAVSGFRFGHLLGGYLGEVAQEADRIEAARRWVLDPARPAPLEDARCPARVLQDAAWIREMHVRLTRDATSSDPEELEVRDTQNDRGIVWAATWREVGSGGLYIDLAAAKRKAERAILIKSGDNGAGVGEAWLVAAEAGPPTSGTWLQGRRRFSSDSATVWKLDAADLPVDEAASLAVEAAKWIDTIAGSRSETEAH